MRKKNHARRSNTRHLIAKLNPRSPIAEQYRTIRTNLQFASVDQSLKTILVTSASPSEGKSVTAANLAVVYAQQGKKVLLVDADLRKPTVHYTFRLNNIRGLSNLLVSPLNIEKTIQTSDIDNLEILTCGPVPPNPSELLGSNRMKEIIEAASSMYDLIIFDTPPVLAVTDAQVLANVVDGTLLVIRSKSTDYEAATKARETLEKAHAKLLGTVLNDQAKRDTDTYYYYGVD